MTSEEYKQALARLNLTVASKATAEALGISVRHSQHLASGKRKVSPQTERLLKALEREHAMEVWAEEIALARSRLRGYPVDS